MAKLIKLFSIVFAAIMMFAICDFSLVVSAATEPTLSTGISYDNYGGNNRLVLSGYLNTYGEYYEPNYWGFDIYRNGSYYGTTGDSTRTVWTKGNRTAVDMYYDYPTAGTYSAEIYVKYDGSNTKHYGSRSLSIVVEEQISAPEIYSISISPSTVKTPWTGTATINTNSDTTKVKVWVGKASDNKAWYVGEMNASRGKTSWTTSSFTINDSSYNQIYAEVYNTGSESDSLSQPITVSAPTPSGTVSLDKNSFTHGEFVHFFVNANADTKSWVAYWMKNGSVSNEEITRKTSGSLSVTSYSGVRSSNYSGVYVYFYSTTTPSLSDTTRGEAYATFTVEGPKAPNGTVSVDKKLYEIGETVRFTVKANDDTKSWVAYWMKNGSVSSEEITRKTSGSLSGTFSAPVNSTAYSGVYVYYYSTNPPSASETTRGEMYSTFTVEAFKPVETVKKPSGTVSVDKTTYTSGNTIKYTITPNSDTKSWVAYWMKNGLISSEEIGRKTSGTLSGTFSASVKSTAYTGIYVDFFDTNSPTSYTKRGQGSANFKVEAVKPVETVKKPSGTVSVDKTTYTSGNTVKYTITPNSDTKSWVAYWVKNGVISSEEIGRKTSGTLSGTFSASVKSTAYTGIYVYFYDTNTPSSFSASGEGSAYFTVKKALDPRVTNLTPKNSTASVGDTVTFSVTSADVTNGVILSVDNYEYKTTKTPYTFNVKMETAGTKKIIAYALDEKGNKVTKTGKYISTSITVKTKADAVTAKSVINSSVILRIDSPYVYNKGNLEVMGGNERNIYPYLTENGVAVAPIRYVGEYLGVFNPVYNSTNKTVTFSNGITVSATYNKDDTTYAPIRDLATKLNNKKVYYKDGFIIIGNISDSGTDKNKYETVMSEVVSQLKSEMIRIPTVTGLKSTYTEGKVDLNATIKSLDSNLTKVTLAVPESDKYKDGRFKYDDSVYSKTFSLKQWSTISSNPLKDLFGNAYNGESVNFNIWVTTSAHPGDSYLIASYEIEKKTAAATAGSLNARSATQSTYDFIINVEGMPKIDGMCYVYDDGFNNDGVSNVVNFDSNNKPISVGPKEEPRKGNFTIGHGTRWYEGMAIRITPEEAYKLAVNKTDKCAAKLVEFMDENSVVLNQNQFDAIVSLMYNAGENIFVEADNLKKLLKQKNLSETDLRNYYSNPKHNHKENDPVCGSCHYVWSGDKYMQGLKDRRMKEVDLFFTPVTGSSSSSNTGTTTAPQADNTSAAQLKLSVTERYAFAEGGLSTTITVTSNKSWKVSTKNAWITKISKTSGKGNGSFNFKIAENKSTSTRTGTITVTDGEVSVNLIVKQEGSLGSYALWSKDPIGGERYITSEQDVPAYSDVAMTQYCGTFKAGKKIWVQDRIDSPNKTKSIAITGEQFGWKRTFIDAEYLTETPPYPEGLLYPLAGATITSSSNQRYGGFNCDYEAKNGTPIFAPADGTITYEIIKISKDHKHLKAGDPISYGNLVIFTSGEYRIRIGHLSEFSLWEEALPNKSTRNSSDETSSLNDIPPKFVERKESGSISVKKGDPIGKTGTAGNANGAHMHIEVLRDGKPVDPKSVFVTWEKN
jgi:GH24 family phage-related lysozyme (muramidase)